MLINELKTTSERNDGRGSTKSIQGRYWIGTFSAEHHPDNPCLKEGYCYIKGQMEKGDGGFEHWQVMLVSTKKMRLCRVIKDYPGAHWELTRSKASSDYVWKEATRVEGTQFEEGEVIDF